MSTLNQRSFAGGEIAPALYARADINKYATGLRKLRNGYVMRHGGQTNRPGTKFLVETFDSVNLTDSKTRIVPFINSDGTPYLLAFGDEYVRVYDADGEIQKDPSKTITGITKANPAVVTINTHGYTTGDYIYVSGVGGMTQITDGIYTVGATAANTFELLDEGGSNINSTGYSSFTSGGTVEKIAHLGTDVAADDLAEMQVQRINYDDAYAVASNTTTIKTALLFSHTSVYPRMLYKNNSTNKWATTVFSINDLGARPNSLAATPSGGGGRTYKVTAVFENGMESYPSQSAQSTSTPVAGSAVTYVSLSWLTTGFCDTAVSYNVYALDNGLYGYIGSATAASGFIDRGYEVDFDQQPPAVRSLFPTSDYPAVVSSAQQRVFFAANSKSPQRAYASRTGNPYLFTLHVPLLDDDSIMFEMVDGEIRHILDLGRIVVLTSKGEWALEGANGAITPTSIGPKQYSTYGAAKVQPVIIGNNAIFVQARGTALRDLGFEQQVDGYAGNDLTVFSSHLFDAYTISYMTYQQIPHSLIWLVRSDGKLLCLTYVREQQILAWSQHDTDGEFESVCTLPVGSEDRVYVVVKRTIEGATKRYIECFSPRTFTDIEDAVFMDSAITVDGRNTGSTTLTISGGIDWYDETLTLTASASTFSVGDVGNKFFLYDADGNLVRFTVDAYSSATVVTGTVDRTVPSGLRATATTSWARAVSSVSGLSHLEGKAVSVIGDGYVIASPNNSAYETITVSSAAIELNDCYAVIHVGLPYLSDVETLDIDTPQGETVSDKHMIVNSVHMHVERTRGLWVGANDPGDDDPLDGLTEVKMRSSEGYDEPVSLTNEKVEVQIASEWNSNGRVFIRQVDPLPMSVLSVQPQGRFPIRG